MIKTYLEWKWDGNTKLATSDHNIKLCGGKKVLEKSSWGLQDITLELILLYFLKEATNIPSKKRRYIGINVHFCLWWY